jgi:hypothetical protein
VIPAPAPVPAPVPAPDSFIRYLENNIFDYGIGTSFTWFDAFFTLIGFATQDLFSIKFLQAFDK